MLEAVQAASAVTRAAAAVVAAAAGAAAATAPARGVRAAGRGVSSSPRREALHGRAGQIALLQTLSSLSRSCWSR